MNKINIIGIVILLLLSVGVFGEKISTTQVSINTGLQIKYPPVNTYLVNTPIELNFHVYNSTGFEVTSSTTSCKLHIYNQSGHIIIENLTSEAIGDYNYTLPLEIYSKVGTYQYIVWCNNSNEGGFVSDSFEITRSDSFSLFSNNYKGIGLIIALLGIIFFLAYVAFNLDNEHLALKVLLLAFGVFGLIILSSIFSLQNPELRLMNLTKWVMIIFVAYLILYLVYYFFLKVYVGRLIKKFKK